MMRTRYVIGWGALALLAACSGDEKASEPAIGAAPKRAKSVVLITVDTLRADHLGCYGYPRKTSPNIDALAAQSIRFDSAWSQWPKTSPSFASMMTGLYPHSTGVTRACGLKLDSRFKLLSERMKAGGFFTGGVVTNPNLGREFGFDQGYDHYCEAWIPAPTPKIEPLPGPECDAKHATAYALEIVDQCDPAKPLFLWVHYTDPHAPYTPPAEYKERFVGDAWFDASVTAPLLDDDKHDVAPVDEAGGIPKYAQLNGENRIAWYVSQYDAEIFTVDEQIGSLLAGLERRGVLDDALVVLTADHGEHLGEQRAFFVHGPVPYEGCTHVPFLVRFPGGADAGVFDKPIGLIDMQPTILEWAGLPVDDELEGHSLLPALGGEGEAAPYVYLGAGYRAEYQRAIRMGKWKLVWVPDESDQRAMKGSEYELYDLTADPGETKNVITDPKNAAVADVLKRRLRQWIDAGAAKNVPDAQHIESMSKAIQDQMKALGYAR